MSNYHYEKEFLKFKTNSIFSSTETLNDKFNLPHQSADLELENSTKIHYDTADGFFIWMADRLIHYQKKTSSTDLGVTNGRLILLWYQSLIKKTVERSYFVSRNLLKILKANYHNKIYTSQTQFSLFSIFP